MHLLGFAELLAGQVATRMRLSRPSAPQGQKAMRFDSRVTPVKLDIDKTLHSAARDAQERRGLTHPSSRAESASWFAVLC